jgi:HPt (histidine-containing phosphotransfer) domain-containing protein
MSTLIDQEALLERVAGDPDFLAAMVDVFAADAPTRLDAIRAGLRQADANVVERAAHSLKGALATMAADAAAAEAFRLEQLGRSGTLEGAAEILTAPPSTRWSNGRPRPTRPEPVPRTQGRLRQ